MRSPTALRRTSLAAVPLATLGMMGLAVATPPSAEAASARNGKCETGEFCYFFNSHHKGSVSDFKKSIPDYGTKQPSCYDFKGKGKGKDKCIKNEAASAWNRSNKTVYVYYNSNWGGATQKIGPGKKVQLNKTLYNNNASHTIGGSGGGNNQKKAFQFFVKDGYTKRQAAGIVGNLMQESGEKVNPRASQAGGVGRGIAQWSTGGRWDSASKDNVVWFAKKKGMSPWSLNLQLKFVKYELDTFSMYGKGPLKKSSTVRKGTVAFQDYFERCGECHTDTRVGYAKQVFNKFS